MQIKGRQRELSLLTEQQSDAFKSFCQKKDDILDQLNDFKESQLKEYNSYKDKIKYAKEQYVLELEKAYEDIELKYDLYKAKTDKEKKEIDESLHKIKESLSAGVQAQLREREKEEEINFYKLTITDNELSDIMALNKIKVSFHQPVVLNKIIWSTYFQKQTTEMCNRILGTTTECGIYKITNLLTKQCYIGQSVNIQDRFKQHVKCGLGIDASATNKLYKAMQQDGVWNFSFELMEECSRTELNEKEKFWIQMYQSDIYGYNSTSGNK